MTAEAVPLPSTIAARRWAGSNYGCIDLTHGRRPRPLSMAVVAEAAAKGYRNSRP